MKTDYRIRGDVIDELAWEPVLNAADIIVHVQNGIVTLKGSVVYYSEKLAAENAVKRVKGVKAVAQHIEVKPACAGRLPDHQIAESVQRALQWSSRIPDEKISIKVDNGWVHLDGSVDWLYQKQRVETIVSDLTGVLAVNNQITVKPPPDINIVKENIRKALERSANLQAGKIYIETQGNKVILKGSARSWNERKEIEKAASAAPGVAEVDDQLAIIY
jgi:osmotically-inducible protein OsmY